MSKLETLTAFLQANLPARVANLEFNSDMEEVSFINAQKDLGLNQYQMAVMEYEAVLSWGASRIANLTRATCARCCWPG